LLEEKAKRKYRKSTTKYFFVKKDLELNEKFT
jgi:hypothetical protein